MKNDHKTKKRLITLLLSLAMIVTYMPAYMLTYATDDVVVTEDEQKDSLSEEQADETEPEELNDDAEVEQQTDDTEAGTTEDSSTDVLSNDTSEEDNKSEVVGGSLKENSISRDVNDVRITASGKMPEDAVLQVVPIPKKDAAAIAEAESGEKTKVSRIKFAYDISILNGAGEKYDPEEYGESISVTFENIKAPESVDILHVKADVTNVDGKLDRDALEDLSEEVAAGNVETENLRSQATDNAVSVDMDSFSVVIGIEGDHQSAGTGLEYDYSIKWITKEVNNNVEYDDDGRLVFHPAVWNEYTATVQVQMAVRKTSDTEDESGSTIPAGAIQIRIPAHVFYGWDDDDVNKNSAGGYNLSMKGVPVDELGYDGISQNQTGDLSYYFYYEDSDGDGQEETIVISNYKDVGSGTFTTQFSYSVDPLKVPGGHPASNEQDVTTQTKWWLNYVDYYQRDLPISFKIDMDLDNDYDGEHDAEHEGELGVAMMTRAASSYQADPMPTDNNGVFLSWDDAWGPKPAEADDYFYIVWQLSYGRGLHAACPPGTPTTNYWAASQGWEMQVSVLPEDNKITIGDQTFQGEYINMMRQYTCYSKALSYYTPSRSENTYLYVASDRLTNLAEGSGSSAANSNNVVGFTRSNYFRNVKYNGIYAGSWKGLDKRDSSSDRYSCGTYYAVLMRYPKSAIDAAGWDRMINEGLTVKGVMTLTETWDSGYKIVKKAPATTSFNLVPGGPGGTFSKQCGSTVKYYRTAEGGQTFLLNGYDVDLNSTGTEKGTYTASWTMVIERTAPTINDECLGQHIEMTDTSDSTLFISASNATRPTGWSPSGQQKLTEDDYEFNGLWISELHEHVGHCTTSTTDDGSLSYRWDANTSYETNYSKLDPICIYTRIRGSSAFEPYCVMYITGASSFRVYQWDGSLDENGDPVKGTEIPKKWGHYAVPDDTVQIRLEHDSEYYKTRIRMNVGVKILPTEHVKSIVQGHVDDGAETYIKDVTSWKSTPLKTDKLDDEGIEHFTYSGSNYGASNVPYDIFYLTSMSSDLRADKNVYVPKRDEQVQQDATSNGYQIAYVRLTATSHVGMNNAVATSTDREDSYKLLKGTFYELLPPGCSVLEDSKIVGIFDMRQASTDTSLNPQYYTDIIEQRYNSPNCRKWITDFSYSTYVDEATGQTMLKIDYEVQDPHYDYSLSTASDWYCYVRFFFVMKNPIQNIEANATGTTTVNNLGFMNRTPGATTPAGEGYTLEGAQMADEKAAFTAIDQEAAASQADDSVANIYAAFGKTTITWNEVTTTETGFSKAVAALEESLNSNVIAANYKSTAEVTLNNDYAYRLRYRTEDGTRADKVVFYDILESGTDLKPTGDWRGSLKNIDLRSIRSKVNAVGDSGATCDPKVYYSTTLTEKNSTNGGYFDLSDGSIWSETAPDDLSSVTAIAVDCSKDTDNKDFVLSDDDTMYLFVQMTAPVNYSKEVDVNGAVASARPFSSIFDTGEGWAEKKYPHDCAVSLHDINIDITKASNPKTGTPDNRCIVEADGSGTIDYAVTVRSNSLSPKGNTYDYQNVVVEDPIPAYLTVNRIEVALNGAEAKDIDSVSDVTYTKDDNNKYTFTISRQHPTLKDPDTGEVTENHDTTFYFYTTVDSLTKSDGQPEEDVKGKWYRNYDNQAKLASANGKDINQLTDTMYHRAEIVSIPVTKKWNDNNNKGRTRPDEIVVTATGKAVKSEGAEPETVGQPYTARISESDNGEWGYTFILPKYYVDTEGASYENQNKWSVITYTVEEAEVNGYSTAIAIGEDTGNGFPVTITNSLPGALKITKVLKNHENVEARIDETTFVFRVLVKLGDDIVYDDIVTMVFSEAGNKTVTIEDLPAGATAVVEEIYAGGNYTVEPSDSGIVTVTINAPPADGEEDNTAEAKFTNTHDGGFSGGHSVENTYGKDSQGDWTFTPDYSTEG